MQELTYHQNGDYLIPDLEAPEAPRIGKYGTMRHQYLRNHHRGIFDGMLLEGSLNAHLEEIDRQANEIWRSIMWLGCRVVAKTVLPIRSPSARTATPGCISWIGQRT